MSERKTRNLAVAKWLHRVLKTAAKSRRQPLQAYVEDTLRIGLKRRGIDVPTD